VGACRRRGQGLVEFALVFPLFLFWLLVSIQHGLIAFQQYSLMAVTQDTARWLSIRPDKTDAEALAQARSVAYSLDSSRITSLVTNPSCATAPCDRSIGDALTVTVTYDVSSWVFLPTTLSFGGGLTFAVQTTLPPYSVTAMIE
jgi:Flp pilus assembly protein TadG